MKFGEEEKYLLPTCANEIGHDGYYCEEHHLKYYFGKTNNPVKNEESLIECKHEYFVSEWQESNTSQVNGGWGRFKTARSIMCKFCLKKINL